MEGVRNETNQIKKLIDLTKSESVAMTTGPSCFALYRIQNLKKKYIKRVEFKM